MNAASGRRLALSLMAPIFMMFIIIDHKYDNHHVNVNGTDGEFQPGTT